VRSCSSRELSKTTRWTSTSPRTSSATTTRGASQRAAERPCHSATPLPLRRALRRLGAFLAALGGACGIRRRCFSPAFSTFSLWSRLPPLSSLISSPNTLHHHDLGSPPELPPAPRSFTGRLLVAGRGPRRRPPAWPSQTLLEAPERLQAAPARWPVGVVPIHAHRVNRVTTPYPASLPRDLGE
jgi:hypothetical protein